MRNTTVAKSSVKSNWLALLLGVALAAVTVQSCSIDKSKYTFVPDDQFPNSMSGAANGGAANGGAANAGGAHAGVTRGFLRVATCSVGQVNRPSRAGRIVKSAGQMAN